MSIQVLLSCKGFVAILAIMLYTDRVLLIFQATNCLLMFFQVRFSCRSSTAKVAQVTHDRLFKCKIQPLNRILRYGVIIVLRWYLFANHFGIFWIST